MIGTTTGSVNNSLDAISVPPDGRVFRLVIREIENLAASTAPATTRSPDDPLAGQLQVRTEFADVVPVRQPA